MPVAPNMPTGIFLVIFFIKKLSKNTKNVSQYAAGSYLGAGAGTLDNQWCVRVSPGCYGNEVVDIYYLAMIVKADDVVQGIKTNMLAQAKHHLALLTEKIKKGIHLDTLSQDTSNIFKFFRSPR